MQERKQQPRLQGRYVFTPIWIISIKDSDLNLYNDDKKQSDQRRRAQSGSTHCEASNLLENITEEE